MSTEIAVSEKSGAGGAGSATDGLASRGGQAGFASLPANPVRKAEIEHLMRSDFARYENEGLSREYQALLEAEQMEVDPDSLPATRPLAADVSRTEMCGSEAGRKLVSAWDQMGGFSAHLANVQRDVGEMVRSIGTVRAQRAFMERFDRDVPIAARLALYDEIAAGRNAYVEPATPGQVKHFAATPAGAILVAEWGSWAPEKVAMLRSRAARLQASMDEDDAFTFWDWFDHLEAGPVVAIFRNLAG